MFYYFGFGSNMDAVSLRAKGVEPLGSWPAVLKGWRLRFNVQHFFRHEGGVGNIEPCPEEPEAQVPGLLHACRDEDLDYLDAAEACGYGYQRVTVTVETASEVVSATAYVGTPEFINERCIPSQRYLNILIRGAEAASLDAAHIAWLREHPVQPLPAYPPFQHPDGEYPVFYPDDLQDHPLYTGLYGAVFDMTNARRRHEFLKQLLGGRDTTLFLLQRLDTSNADESWDDIRYDRLSGAQVRYLNAYLHEYAREYRYVGRLRYP